MVHLPEGMFKVFVQQQKRMGSWRTKFHFGYLLAYVCEYLNKNNIDPILDPSTGEVIPIDIRTLHNLHKRHFNRCLCKNLLGEKDLKGNIPEYVILPMTTTKLSDEDFIKRYEEEIMAYYANRYGLEFISRDEYRQYFEDGKDSKMIIDISTGSMEELDTEIQRLNSFKEEEA